MIWIIVCKDKVGSLPRRMAVIEDHRKYLSTNPIKTLLSGPLTDFDGETMNGSFFMVCLLYTSPSPRDMRRSRMPSSA